MMQSQWMQAPALRFAGSCAVLASALLGAGVLSHFDGPGLAVHGFDHFHDVLALQPDVLVELPVLVAVADVAETPAAAVLEAFPGLFPSRGPPA
jgi:hypothetical protein